ncbi:MAG: hypothetical protein H6Q26_332 [Bacteroidetes bacterium]|nr:hypothetical protein [Bacteroidota bacterium]
MLNGHKLMKFYLIYIIYSNEKREFSHLMDIIFVHFKKIACIYAKGWKYGICHLRIGTLSLPFSN